MNAGTPVGPAALLEDDTHLFEYNPVLPRSRTRRPSAPRVKPCPRNREEPTQPRDAERFVFPVDEREDVGFRAEVNRMSCFKSACSSCSSAYARRCAWNRFIVRAGGALSAFATDTRPRNTPSRASFRQRDSMNG